MSWRFVWQPAAVCVLQSAVPEQAPLPVLTLPQMKISLRGTEVALIAAPNPCWLPASTLLKKLRKPTPSAIVVSCVAVPSSYTCRPKETTGNDSLGGSGAAGTVSQLDGGSSVRDRRGWHRARHAPVVQLDGSPARRHAARGRSKQGGGGDDER